MMRPMSDLRPLPRRRGRLASYDRPARWLGDQRPVPARRARPARRRRAADVPRHPGHARWCRGRRRGGPTTATSRRCSSPSSMRGEVAIAGRVGRQRLWDLAERVYPADAVVPAARGAAAAERAPARARSASPGKPPPCPVEPNASARPASRPWSRAPGRAGGSTPRRSASPSPAGRRCCRRSTGWSTTAPGRRAVRVRVRARDVQADGEAALGLLRAADPARRPAGRQARRDRRPQGRRAAGATPSTRTCRSPAPSRRAVEAELAELASWLGLEAVERG